MTELDQWVRDRDQLVNAFLLKFSIRFHIFVNVNIYLAAYEILPVAIFDFIGIDVLDADGLSSVFGNFDWINGLDFCNGEKRLKIFLPAAMSPTIVRGSGFWLVFGVDDNDDAGDIMWEALLALFMLRFTLAAFFCNGISMFVLHLVTLRCTDADTDRLNGIFVAIFDVFLGDDGSDEMTGIWLADGSSLVNVFCLINVDVPGVWAAPSDCCRFNFTFSSGEFFGAVVVVGLRLVCLVSFDAIAGRILRNDSALRWMSDLARAIDGVVVFVGSGDFSVVGLATADVVRGERDLFAGDVVTDLTTGGETGLAAGFVSFVILYGDTYAGFFLPRMALGSEASFWSAVVVFSLSLGITIRGDFTPFKLVGCCGGAECPFAYGSSCFGAVTSGRKDDILFKSANLSDDFLV